MTIQEMIRANAEMVVEQLRQVSDVKDFGYNAESVAWVDGFIQRQRVNPDMDEAGVHQMTQNLGSYLGECVIACYGGEWRQEEGMWAVTFNEANAVFPFNKVGKQFANGSEDSVRGWFETIPVIFARYIKPPPSPQKRPWWKRGG
jgi:hypothetical protein